MITQDELKSILHYAPETGLFTWVGARGRCKAGSLAGNVTKSGYLRLKVGKRQYFAHRLAFLYMDGTLPAETDHINGDRLDNRWENLRDVSKQENLKNLGITKRNRTGIIGVFMHKASALWQCQINVDGDKTVIGYYSDFFEACCRRKSAELRLGYHANHGKRDSYR